MRKRRIAHGASLNQFLFLRNKLPSRPFSFGHPAKLGPVVSERSFANTRAKSSPRRRLLLSGELRLLPSALRYSGLYRGHRLRDDGVDAQHSESCAGLGRVPINTVGAPKLGSVGKPIFTDKAR